MDTTLVVNPGSSSKKYALYREGREVFSALFERTGDGFSQCVEINGTRQQCEGSTMGEYEDGLHQVLEKALVHGVLTNATEITRVGIRVVAPGTFFTKHRVIDDAYVEKLRALAEAAPLHIPHQLSELALIRTVFPHARIIGVSDSAFHATLPAHAHRYSIPKKDAQHFDLYRFGYHGLSVASVVRQVAKQIGNIPHRMIVCHIGSGMSVTALKDGKSVETTMGFAPTSGLMMGARAGEVDPAALLYLYKCYGNNIEKTELAVSQMGGLKGMLGNSDLRVAIDRYTKKDPDATIAIPMYFEGIRKSIGAMSAVLGGLDVLALTGTAPERNAQVRALITERFEYLGIVISEKANEDLGGNRGTVSTPHSKVSVYVVHTEEIAEIASIASVF